MAKERSLEQIEAQMIKLQEKKSALHKELKVLAAERRKIILSDSPSTGGVVVEPEPAMLSAKVN